MKRLSVSGRTRLAARPVQRLRPSVRSGSKPTVILRQGRILALCLLLCLGGCINRPAGPSPVPADALPADGRDSTNDLTVAGFGFGRNRNEQAAVTWARKTAQASLLQQSSGSFFTYRTTSGKLVLEAHADGRLSALRNQEQLQTFRNGEYWEAFVIYTNKASIKLPENLQTSSVRVELEISDLNDLLLTSVKAALQKVLQSYTPAEEPFEGYIFLQELQLTPGPGEAPHAVSTRYFIAY